MIGGKPNTPIKECYLRLASYPTSILTIIPSISSIRRLTLKSTGMNVSSTEKVSAKCRIK